MSGFLQGRARYMNEVLVDTNIMVYLFDRKADLREMLDSFFQSPFSVITLKICINELSSIKRNDVREFFINYGINILDYGDSKVADDVILEACKKNGYLLLTEDRILIKRSEKNGIKTLSFAGRTLKFNA